jgi:hypothetical protein
VSIRSPAHPPLATKMRSFARHCYRVQTGESQSGVELHKGDKMRAFNIPVAFLTEGETEEIAASNLVEALVDAALTQDHRRDAGHDDLGNIESWFMPNHPSVDNGADGEEILVWHPASGDFDKDAQHQADEEVNRYREDGLYSLARIIIEKDRPGLIFNSDEIERALDNTSLTQDYGYFLDKLRDTLYDAGVLTEYDE